ncbi:phosphopentomutase [Anaeropeptidivorans aminofermentans]|jgi:phosphopentomutase|uniref:phosphopentomutase n=1 Tax=Anaeropeptidivorans aminofermentans TaxID=2934315 RepID=UPI002024D228|nr:phosphopentomutase [Anaeropeptidivorans aminofermentans]MBE6012341.1 phosphopentomutase [Lachnospiraceae bacterium]
MKRVILVVIDSVGIGELPDAKNYGDEGSNTLLNIKRERPDMELKNMLSIGLSHIEGGKGLATGEYTPEGAFGRLAESSKGKDTTTGHWEIAGIIIDNPFPTYPKGFPKEVIDEFEKLTGRKVIANCPASGTEIIERLGKEHMETGALIVYTSADSVFQIAAHEEIVPIEELYDICQKARDMLTGPHAVSRVIARPFLGSPGSFKRTSNRKDFSIEPIKDTMLDYIKASGLQVAAVGKIEDIFSGKGITQAVHTTSNMDGVDKTLDYMDTVENGLIFTNLVDFDMLYGHRNDVDGYAEALIAFDNRLPEIKAKLRPDDILMITADHGCDPTTESTDHSREYIPLLIYGDKVKAGTNIGTRKTFSDIGKTILDYLSVEGKLDGESFLNLFTIK